MSPIVNTHVIYTSFFSGKICNTGVSTADATTDGADDDIFYVLNYFQLNNNIHTPFLCSIPIFLNTNAISVSQCRANTGANHHGVSFTCCNTDVH